MTRRTDKKSLCGVNLALEIIGDPWSLLIVRDIAFSGKHTYNSFLASEEGIAKNILASRLDLLKRHEILTRDDSAQDKRIKYYTLTEKGLELIPILFSLLSWSSGYGPSPSPNQPFRTIYASDPKGMVRTSINAVRQGRAIFQGEQSVMKELGAQ